MNEDDMKKYAGYAAKANADPVCRVNNGTWTSLMRIVEEEGGKLTNDELAPPILSAVYEVLRDERGMSHEEIMTAVEETYGRTAST